MRWYGWLFPALLCVSIVQCDNDNDDTDQSDTTNQITGRVTAPNAVDPVSGATVWIAAEPSSRSIVHVNSRVKALTDDEGVSCADAPEETADVDCTGVDGRFSLACDEGGDITVKFAKGSFFGAVTIPCGTEPESDDFAFPASPAEGGAAIAVVTGAFDAIENVLAKLGLGTLTSEGALDSAASFSFTLIDGNSTLDDATYMNVDAFASDVNNLLAYDIIFINCGTDDEDMLADPAIIARFQEYLAAGGKLYVTDLSYDFVEQPFPSFMDFLNDGTDSAVPETLDVAQVGVPDITVNATVNDADMSAWLDTITINTGSLETCSVETPNGTTGARNSDGTVTIGGFLSGWAVMDMAHEGTSPTLWIQGPVDYFAIPSFTIVEDVVKPLTVTQNIGEGRLLYSSYHTVNDCLTTGFWPQERILQYLIFEL